MAFDPLKSVKSAALTGLQKGINKSLGTSGSFLGNAVNSLLGGMSQNLFEVGNAFDTISAVTSLKLDSVVAGGETGFVTGKCPERAAAGDIAANRGGKGVTQSLQDHVINTDPTGTIDKNRNNSHVRGNTYYPLAWASDKFYMKLRFFDYDRTDLFRAAKNKEKFTVVLPLPVELTDSQRSEYATADMKTVGTILTEGGSGGAVKQAAMFGLNTVADKALGLLPDTARSLAGDAGFNSETLVNAVEQSMGQAPNPQPSVLFKGPSLREFNFTWTFNPRDVNESVRIRETVERLKASALARKAYNNSTGVLRYPEICMLNFYPWDASRNKNSIYGWGEKSIIRIKRCFISNITTNYAPSGVPSFFAGTVGAPVFIQLSMTFKEIEFFTSEDWLSYKGSAAEGTAPGINAGIQKAATGIIDGSRDLLGAALTQ